MNNKENEHERLYNAALRAINNLFSHTGVSIYRTKRDLESIKDEIDVMIDSLEDMMDYELND